MLMRYRKLTAEQGPLGRNLSSVFPREDSNPHKQIQSLLCYHYTTGDRSVDIDNISNPLFLSQERLFQKSDGF